MQSSKASKFVTRLVRCNMVMARSAHPTNCSPCVLTAAKLSGVLLRKSACGTCETGRREEQNGGGVSDLSELKVFSKNYSQRVFLQPAEPRAHLLETTALIDQADILESKARVGKQVQDDEQGQATCVRPQIAADQSIVDREQAG